jgi:hypothetical protein
MREITTWIIRLCFFHIEADTLGGREYTLMAKFDTVLKLKKKKKEKKKKKKKKINS